MSEYSFFGAVEKSFDKAARFTQWDPGLLEQIKQCNAVYRMHFPVKINEITADGVEEIRYEPEMFDFGKVEVDPAALEIGRAHV